MSGLLKQIASITAYAAGFTFGTYGALKAVDAIENKCPMKSCAIRITRSNAVTFSVSSAEQRGHVVASIKKNGQTQEFTGTPRQVRMQLVEHGFEQYAEQLA